MAQGGRVLAESGLTSTVAYLYGRDCLGEERDGEMLYYLNDAEGYVRQGVDESGAVKRAWLFDPDGSILEGLDGPVSHLLCGGMYDWSTGLVYHNGRYFDPNLGIWLALMPLVVLQGWPGRKKKRKGAHPWMLLLCLGLFTMGSLTGCGDGDCDPISSDLPSISGGCTNLSSETPYIISSGTETSLGNVAVSKVDTDVIELHFGNSVKASGEPAGISINVAVYVPPGATGTLKFLQIGSPCNKWETESGDIFYHGLENAPWRFDHDGIVQ